MDVGSGEFLKSAAGPLACFYAIACALNCGAAWRAWPRAGRPHASTAWALVAEGFAALAVASLAGSPPQLPGLIQRTIDAALGPVTLTCGMFALLVAAYLARRLLVRPAVAWTVLNLSFLFLGLSLADQEFAGLVMTADNVPMLGMVYLLGFFLWLAAYQAVRNDARLAAGSPPTEAESPERVLVWPDLVYSELIVMILVTVLLLVWSLLVRAPLEQPANPAITPNPAKAPWYFVGLQELLTYSDAWLAGVVIPCAAILGLAAIPYLDFNRRESGYYSLRPRRFACAVFLLGFLMLWILPILIGTFLRGPNWSFLGLYGPRDAQNAAALANVRLSDLVWVNLLGREIPQAAEGSGAVVRWCGVLWRELPGIALVAGWFLVLPPLGARTLLRGFRREMGWTRYALMSFLLLLMLLLPLKMMLRWTLNVNYVVSLPELGLNV